MLRNYLATALRNMARNKLYAAINIVGLAVGFAAAIFAALFVRYELTYDQWIPDHENIYQITTTVAPQLGAMPRESESNFREVAALLKLDFNDVAETARWMSYGATVLRRGDIRAIEPLVGEVDPSLVNIFKFPAVAGNYATSLDRPDGIILTRTIAQKYFGRDNPIGESIELMGHPMQVTAVIEDWPLNSTIPFQALFSSRASFAKIAAIDAQTTGAGPEPFFMMVSATFLRLKPGASPEALQAGLPSFVERHIRKTWGAVTLTLRPITSRHLDPVNRSYGVVRERILASIYGVASVGLLILTAAALNFINLMTARATRRAIEVGVRKVTGANQPTLILQFVGETTLYALLGMALALFAVGMLLPQFRALLDRGIVFDPGADPELFLGIAALPFIVGVLAGFYPAFVLSRFRPASALKSGRAKPVGANSVVRRGLVMVQFAILIGLVVGTSIIYRQTSYLMNESLRFDKDQVLVVPAGCSEPFRQGLIGLPGVRGAACSWGVVNGGYIASASANGKDIGDLTIDPIDFGFFDIYGVKPLAGRLFDPTYGMDKAGDDAVNPTVIVNESALRKLGFASPEAALGQSIAWRRLVPGLRSTAGRPLEPSQIVGVVPDFGLSDEWVGQPLIYYTDIRMLLPGGGPGSDYGATVNIKLSGRDVPETLRAIDRLWDQVDKSGRPIQRSFIDQQLQQIYRDTTRQAALFAVFAAVAIFIASLGLFGLSAFTAERRTKEIGVRKAMGANRRDILRLLVWEFVKPVLWANVIAWPLCYVVMQRWLAGFTLHINPSPVIFLAASALALVIAVLTVSGHAILIARAQPVTALRYE